MKGFGDALSEGSKRETREVMSAVGGPAPVYPIARPERFELPTFWFVAEFHPLHPTTPANQDQQNNRKRCCGFAPFWLALAAVHGHFHGQWGDSGGLRWATTSWCATIWLSTGTTPPCSPERETGTLKIGFSDMMCDVGNAAIKDDIANIARNREVLHCLSCIARFLGHFSGLPTIRPSGFRDPWAFPVTNPPRSPGSGLLGRLHRFS